LLKILIILALKCLSNYAVFIKWYFIQLEDSNYKPLDPDTIRLPPPAPPTERLLEAVKAFYMPPGHFAPRDR